MSSVFNKECLRVNAVKRFMELQSSEKQDLDDLIAVAAEVCGMPMALVTLLDDEMQWFKAKKGLEGSSTLKEEAFCRYTIKGDNVFIVEDTHKDDRFALSPFVTGEPRIRFYAGAPLTTQDGYNVGSLCVIDCHPRSLNAAQVSCLKTLARQVMHRMELSLSLQTLQHTVEEVNCQKDKLLELTVIHNSFLDSFSDHFILLDESLRIITYNKAWKEFATAAFDKEPAKGEEMIAYVSGELKLDFTELAKTALSGEEVNFERIAQNKNPGVYPFWYKARLAAFRNLEGKIIGISIIMTDINSEKEKLSAIENQNKSLSEIAKLQSHDIRGPLSNILGILNLFKDNQYPFSEQFFSMLYQSATKLDDVIRAIVYKADDGRAHALKS